jgi:hypothetical protein
VQSSLPQTNKQTAKKTKKVKGERKGAKRVGWLAGCSSFYLVGRILCLFVVVGLAYQGP